VILFFVFFLMSNAVNDVNEVRGYIDVRGVEGSKWDKRALKRRLGVMLYDVRAITDTASLYSGWTLEEILEPVDGIRTADPSHKLSSNEKSSMLLALKVRLMIEKKLV
jgi:hypothetical protein